MEGSVDVELERKLPEPEVHEIFISESILSCNDQQCTDKRCNNENTKLALSTLVVILLNASCTYHYLKIANIGGSVIPFGGPIARGVSSFWHLQRPGRTRLWIETCEILKSESDGICAECMGKIVACTSILVTANLVTLEFSTRMGNSAFDAAKMFLIQAAIHNVAHVTAVPFLGVLIVKIREDRCAYEDALWSAGLEVSKLVNKEKPWNRVKEEYTKEPKNYKSAAISLKEQALRILSS